MKFKRLNISDVVEITPKVFEDKRGFFCETFRLNKFRKILKVKNLNFVQDNLSKSKKHTLRGLHYQIKNTQDKLISVLHGEIFDVAVDLRKNSKTFGKYFSIIISQDSEFSFYIPKGFAHGFLCLSKECTVNYKCSQYRHKESETTLNWNDKDLNIKWPIKNPILSKKDKIGKNLDYFKK